MRGVIILIGAVLLIVMSGAFILGLTEFRSREYSQQDDITTQMGETTAYITLALPLLDDDIGWVTITSTLPEDTPRPVSYETSIQSLTVGGLKEGQTRRLTTIYRYSQLREGLYYVADLASRMTPALLILGVIGLVAVGVYAMWPRRGPPE